MLPLFLLGSACPSESESEQPKASHPLWSDFNESEDKLDKDKCIVTKLGRAGLRFHVAGHQKCFNINDACNKSESNIVQTDTDRKVVDWILTPNFYGSLTKEKFPKTFEKGMISKVDNNDKEGGVPVSFLEEWLAIDPMDYTNAILIVSTGVEGKLGVSGLFKEALKAKKEKAKIKDYEILKSTDAIRVHNRYIKEGKKVFTFIHMID